MGNSTVHACIIMLHHTDEYLSVHMITAAFQFRCPRAASTPRGKQAGRGRGGPSLVGSGGGRAPEGEGGRAARTTWTPLAPTLSPATNTSTPNNNNNNSSSSRLSSSCCQNHPPLLPPLSPLPPTPPLPPPHHQPHSSTHRHSAHLQTVQSTNLQRQRDCTSATFHFGSESQTYASYFT